jgi:hypothetical protein
VVLASLFQVPLAAQERPTASPAAQVGLIVTPKWGQSKEVQLDYEQECYGRARVETGVDPAMVAAADSADQPDSAGAGPTAGVISGRRMERSERLRAGGLENFRKVMQGCLEGGGYNAE